MIPPVNCGMTLLDDINGMGAYAARSTVWVKDALALCTHAYTYDALTVYYIRTMLHFQGCRPLLLSPATRCA